MTPALSVGSPAFEFETVAARVVFAADWLITATARLSYRPELLPYPHQVLAMRALRGEDGCS